MKQMLGALSTLYTIIGLFYAISTWNNQQEYYEECKNRIQLYAKPDESTWALIGFYARGEKGLLDIALDALSWPEKIFLLSSEPNFIAEGNRAFAEIEKASGAASLERKYCSDIKRP